MFDSFEVRFPDDETRSVKVYFKDYGVKNIVTEYIIFLNGILYPEINAVISFNHSMIDSESPDHSGI